MRDNDAYLSTTKQKEIPKITNGIFIAFALLEKNQARKILSNMLYFLDSMKTAFSLGQKITMRTVALVFMTLFTATSISIYATRSLVRERVIDQLINQSAEYTETINHVLTLQKETVNLIASNPNIPLALKSTSSAQQLGNDLLRMQQAAPSIHSISITDLRGMIRMSTEKNKLGKNISAMDHIKHGLIGTYIGTKDIVNGLRTYAIASPIIEANGTTNGILVVELKTESIVRIAQQMRTSESSSILLSGTEDNTRCLSMYNDVLSRDGIIDRTISHTNKKNTILPENPPQEKEIEILCNKATKSTDGLYSVSYEGTKYIAAHQTLRGLGIGVISYMPEEFLYGDNRLFLMLYAGAASILFLLSIIFSLRLAQQITNPLHIIRNSLAQMKAGNLLHKRSIYTKDELEELDKDLSEFTKRLEEAYVLLEERVSKHANALAEEHAKDEALFESIGDGFITVDLNGKILSANHEAAVLLGWNPAQLIGNSIESVLHFYRRDKKPLAKEDDPVYIALKTKRQAETTPLMTIMCMRKNNVPFPVGITATPFHIQGDMRGAVIMLRDLTEEKRMDRMKSEFISLASHQLRTPLTSIGWYIELLQGNNSDLSQEQNDYVVQITNAHRRMVELVNSLLNVSRIELGRMKIVPEHVTIKDIVKSAEENVLPLINKRHQQFKKNLPKMDVNVDPALVNIVLSNLLTNAAKYTPEEGLVELSIEIDKNKEELLFSVSDTGLGIPQEQQGRIFEKLFRADNVIIADTEGSGIGLYITKNTVEAWGGRLWFESREGEGTTFFFTVPMNMENISEEQKEEKNKNEEEVDE